MKKVNLILCCFLIFSFACTKKEKRSYKLPVEQKKEVIPPYKAYYHPDSVELEKIQISGKIDQTTAVMLVANSSKEIKADYLNYMMETYKSVSPPESRLEPMFDAEHLGRFIVWLYVNENTDNLEQIFSAIGKVFRNGTGDARFLAKYGICQTMIYESRELDVNYNSAYDQWLKNTIRGYWLVLIDEMESGRS